MIHSNTYVAEIIFKEDHFLRIDTVAFAITIIKRDSQYRVFTSIMERENPLIDYADFRVRVPDDICQFHSKELGFRDFLELRALARNWPNCAAPRLWRFMKKTFPEYATLYVG